MRRAFIPDEKTWEELGELVVERIILGVTDQTGVDGRPLKVNEEGTLRRKAARGLPLVSLLDAERRFLDRATYEVEADGDGATVWVNPDRAPPEMLEGLAARGYDNWFGVSPETQDLISERLADLAERVLAEPGGEVSR